jgi:hypothetical protein
LRALEDENGKLKKLLAEQMFPSQALLRNTLPGKGQCDVVRHQFKKMVTMRPCPPLVRGQWAHEQSGMLWFTCVRRTV